MFVKQRLIDPFNNYWTRLMVFCSKTHTSSPSSVIHNSYTELNHSKDVLGSGKERKETSNQYWLRTVSAFTKISPRLCKLNGGMNSVHWNRSAVIFLFSQLKTFTNLDNAYILVKQWIVKKYAYILCLIESNQYLESPIVKN